MCGLDIPVYCGTKTEIDFPVIGDFLKEIVGKFIFYEVNYIQSDPPEVTHSGFIRSLTTISFNMPDFIFYEEIPPFERVKFDTIYEAWLHHEIMKVYLKMHGINHLVKKKKWNKIANSKNWFLVFEVFKLEFESHQSIKEMAHLNSFTKTKLGWMRKKQAFQKEYVFSFTSENDLKIQLRTALIDKIKKQ